MNEDEEGRQNPWAEPLEGETLVEYVNRLRDGLRTPDIWYTVGE